MPRFKSPGPGPGAAAPAQAVRSKSPASSRAARAASRPLPDVSLASLKAAVVDAAADLAGDRTTLAHTGEEQGDGQHTTLFALPRQNSLSFSSIVLGGKCAPARTQNARLARYSAELSVPRPGSDVAARHPSRPHRIPPRAPPPVIRIE